MSTLSDGTAYKTSRAADGTTLYQITSSPNKAYASAIGKYLDDKNFSRLESGRSYSFYTAPNTAAVSAPAAPKPAATPAPTSLTQMAPTNQTVLPWNVGLNSTLNNPTIDYTTKPQTTTAPTAPASNYSVQSVGGLTLTAPNLNSLPDRLQAAEAKLADAQSKLNPLDPSSLANFSIAMAELAAARQATTTNPAPGGHVTAGQTPGQIGPEDYPAISQGVPATTGKVEKIPGQVSSPTSNANTSSGGTINPNTGSVSVNPGTGNVQTAPVQVGTTSPSTPLPTTPQPGGTPDPAGQGNPLNPAPTGGSTTGNQVTDDLTRKITSLLDAQMARDAAQAAEIERLRGDITNRANPYDTNGQDFKSLLQMKRDNVVRDTNGADRAARAALAARGMLGSGYEAAAVGNIASTRSRGLSDAEGQLRDMFFQGRQNFEDSRTRSLLSLANAQRDPSALATSLLGMQQAQQRYFLDRQDAENKLGADTVSTLISLAPLLAKALGVLV